MAYDEEFAQRIREHMAPERGITEKKMFGGLGFMVDGKMAVAASGRGGLMVRVDPARADELTAADGVGRMVMRGKAMAGWLLVDSGATASDADLARWIATGVEYARSLPAT